jgi:RNA recognition motif-containing protein
MENHALPVERLCDTLKMPHGLVHSNSAKSRRSDFLDRMSSTVFLGNLPVWVTADDIKAWLISDSLVADSVKVIRNPETQESKGFAFIEAPNQEEMFAIIQRYNGAPLEDRKLRANPAQPPRPKGALRTDAPPTTPAAAAAVDRPRRTGARKAVRRDKPAPQGLLGEELAKVL